MKEAYTKASDLAAKNASQGKMQYDRKVRSTVLQPGDKVLVRNLTPRGGPGKLRSFWEDKIHVVLGPDSPVYNVQSESKGGGGGGGLVHYIAICYSAHICYSIAICYSL